MRSSLCKSLAQEGLDAGPATIAFHPARRQEGAAPSESTIWRALCRLGFMVPEPHKRPGSSIVRFVADQPNERWQADITNVVLARRYEVEVFNQLDDHSRPWLGPMPGASSRRPTWWSAPTRPPRPTALRPATSPTTPLCSPPAYLSDLSVPRVGRFLASHRVGLVVRTELYDDRPLAAGPAAGCRGYPEPAIGKGPSRSSCCAIGTLSSRPSSTTADP